MAGEIKLAIILAATMQGGQAFNQAGGGIKGIAAAAKAAVPMLAAFAAHAAFGFLKDSINIAMEFEQVMAEAGSIIGQTANEMHDLGLEIRAMSKEIPKTPADLGLALYDIFSAGITDTSDAMNALELSAKAASAGLTETATAAKAGIATMNAFGMEASELEHIFDVQFLTIKFGILRYEELAGVIGALAPSAKAAGQSMESMFGALAVLTKQGLNAAQAATALARAMDAITMPAAIRKAAELGISFVELTADARRLQDEYVSQKGALDDLNASYTETEANVKSLGDEMAKVSLDQAKNRLQISKIEREASQQGRELTEQELTQIDELKKANDELDFTYENLRVSQMESKIASTDISNAMEEQKKTTNAAQKAFDEQVAATGNFRPLVDIIAEIGEKYGHLGEAAKADIISQMFPQIRAKRAVLAIMGNEEELMEMTDQMMTQAGAMGEAFAINTETAAAGHQLMKNSVTDLQIEMGEKMIPTMEKFYEVLQEAIIPMIQNAFIPILEAMMPVLKQIAEVAGWLGSLFAEYPEMLWLIIGAIIAWKVAQMALNISMMANPLGLVIMAVAGLIAMIFLLIKHWDDVVAAFQRVGDAFTSVYEAHIKPTVDAISGAIKDIVEGWSWLWDIVLMFAEGFAILFDTLIKPQLGFFVSGIELIIDALQWLWDMILKIGEAFDDVFGGINDMISGTGEFIGGIGEGLGGFLGFADGGVVTSPTLGLLGERGAEAVIPLKNGAVPVDFAGSVGGGDTITIVIEAGKLPQEETPESLAEKVAQGLTEAKMRGATGQVT